MGDGTSLPVGHVGSDLLIRLLADSSDLGIFVGIWCVLVENAIGKYIIEVYEVRESGRHFNSCKQSLDSGFSLCLRVVTLAFCATFWAYEVTATGLSW